VIWSSVAVFREATGNAILAVTNRYTMLPLAYVAVILMMTIGKDLAEYAIRRTSSANYRVAIEVVYVAISSVFGIMLWKGQRREM